MSDDIAIAVRNVSKRYHVYENQRVRLRHAFTQKSAAGVSEIWALRDVSFEVEKGDAVGIIGRNGSGKSTLLEIITGTLKPTTGEAAVNGRIAALLELGSGFNPEYTGRENVFLNALLMGLTRADVDARFDDIAGFADIGDVLDRPVKTYSSGMLVRLAFAVQVALDPDILIVDEALSVGDYFFQQKCFGRLRQMRDDGLTLLFVSHDMNAVNTLCSKAIYLQKGQMRFSGDKRMAIHEYLAESTSGQEAESVGGSPHVEIRKQALPSIIPERVTWRRTSGEIPKEGGLLAVALENSKGQLTSDIRIGDTINLRVYFVPDSGSASHIYFSIKDKFDQLIFTSGTYYLGMEKDMGGLECGVVALVEFGLVGNLAAGGYSFFVSQGLPAPPNRIGAIIDRVDGIGPLSIHFDYQKDRAPFLGPFGLSVNGCGIIDVHNRR